MKKAIVESTEGTRVKVRIPELHKVSGAVGATPSNELPYATICTMPGCRPNLRPGDVVLVSFENDEYGTPIIMGMLFTDRDSSGIADLELGSLKVNVNVELPEDTKIGSLSAKNLLNLQNISENIQLAIDEIRKSVHDDKQSVLSLINDVEDELDNFSSVITQAKEDLEVTKKTVSEQGQSISKIEQRVTTIETSPLILKPVSYGPASPNTVSNPKEGQIYLHIQ